MAKSDKYDRFQGELSKTEARTVLNSLVRNYLSVKNQNSKILQRLVRLDNNQKFYLNKRLPARGGYKKYEEERIAFLREFHATRKQIGNIIGRIYIDQDADGKPKYFVKLSKAKIDKLLALLK